MNITVKNGTGAVETLECESGALLMRVLAERDLVEAVCGGECSCATCQVYVDPCFLEKLSAPGELEREILGEMTNTRPSSRLSCQITLSDALSGMEIEIAKPG